MTDRGLIEQFVRNNSQAAFGQLVQRHAALVYSTCRRELSDAALAEDCTQAVFLILARKANRLLRIGSLTGWLFTTARLAARDAIKQEARRRRRESAIMEHVQSETERETTAWNAIEPELNDTLASMSSTDRDLILMRFVEQFSHADIAASMGIKEDTARIRVSRAVDRLRTRLLSKLGAGAGVLAGIVLADLLAGRAVDAAAVDVASHLSAVSHWPTSLSAASVATAPHAHSIAQGALRAMSRTTLLKVVTAGACVTGVAVVALSPIGAHANLVPPFRLFMNVPPPPLAAGAPSTLSTSQEAVTKPTAGYTETYVLQKDGVEIGRQTGTLTSVTPDEQAWTFTTSVTTSANGQKQSVSEDGSFGLSTIGHPDWVKLNADVNGAKQVVSIDFTKSPVTMNATINGLAVTVAMPYKAGDYLVIGDNLTLMSVDLRSIDRPKGKDLRLPFTSVDGPLSGTMTWSSAGEEPITVKGKTVMCSIYDVADMKVDQPISPALQAVVNANLGQRFWVDAGGSIVKLAKIKDNLVVIRE